KEVIAAILRKHLSGEPDWGKRLQSLHSQVVKLQGELKAHVEKIRNQKTEIGRLQELHQRASAELEKVKHLSGSGDGWVSVSERLPAYDVDVHLWAEGWSGVYCGYWRHSHEWIGRRRAESLDALPNTDPTYWRPFPAPPVSG